jgi:hypothetical protein
MAKASDKDEGLKRLGGGRWQTRDERFTVEPQSGTWVVVDAEQTDDLGLALVRGPFGTLTAAKAAIEAARDGEPSPSPLAERVAKLRDRPSTKSAGAGAATAKDEAPDKRAKAGTKDEAKPRPAPKAKAEAESEPRWVLALEPAERRRAKRLIADLTQADASDPEGTVRRDLVGDVPAVAGFAVGRALANLGPDAKPAAVARLLADGRDDELGVRWRLVDDEDRPITLGST